MEEYQRKQVKICEWVEELRNKLKIIRDSVGGKKARAKQKMKERHDISARERKFVEGDTVLIRTPGMSSKLDEAWDGHYEVLRAVNRVAYEIAVAGC